MCVSNIEDGSILQSTRNSNEDWRKRSTTRLSKPFKLLDLILIQITYSAEGAWISGYLLSDGVVPLDLCSSGGVTTRDLESSCSLVEVGLEFTTNDTSVDSIDTLTFGSKLDISNHFLCSFTVSLISSSTVGKVALGTSDQVLLRTVKSKVVAGILVRASTDTIQALLQCLSDGIVSVVFGRLADSIEGVTRLGLLLKLGNRIFAVFTRRHKLSSGEHPPVSKVLELLVTSFSGEFLLGFKGLQPARCCLSKVTLVLPTKFFDLRLGEVTTELLLGLNNLPFKCFLSILLSLFLILALGVVELTNSITKTRQLSSVEFSHRLRFSSTKTDTSLFEFLKILRTKLTSLSCTLQKAKGFTALKTNHGLITA